MPTESFEGSIVESNKRLSKEEEEEYSRLELALGEYSKKSDTPTADEERGATSNMLRINELYAKKIGATPNLEE